MISEDIRRASLSDLRARKNRGELHSDKAKVEDDQLPPEFWEEADLDRPSDRKSVHLKLDPEVFDFFKRGGKGHLTRMQNVLAAYVRAEQRRR